MTRAQFLNDLYRRLSALSQEQAEQHLTYYAEMLADRMEEGMSEEEAVASMEPLDVITQRILQDEGLPDSPPQPPQPPRYPDLPETDGSRFTKAPDRSRSGIRKRLILALLWVAAIAAAISAVGRWATRHYASADIAVAEEAPVDYGIAEEYTENWVEYADDWEEFTDWWEWGELLYADLEDLQNLNITPDGVQGNHFQLMPGSILMQDYIQVGPDGVDSGSHLGKGAGGAVPAERYRFEGDIYRLGPGEATGLSVTWHTGIVQIQGWDQDYIQFQEFSDTKLKKSQELEYSVDGDTLYINKGAGLDKGLMVWAPTRMLDYLSVEATTAEIYFDQLAAAQGLAHSTTGNIVVTNAAFGNLDVEASTGGTALRCVAAVDLGVDVTSGSVFLDAVAAYDLDVSTSSGSISGYVIGGCIDLETTSGKINVNAAAGELELESTSGTVTASLPGDAAANHVGVETTSGDVVVRMPAETRFALNFDSSAGDFDRGPFPTVRSEDTYFTDGGAPSVMLEVSTTSGDLRLGAT